MLFIVYTHDNPLVGIVLMVILIGFTGTLFDVSLNDFGGFDPLLYAYEGLRSFTRIFPNLFFALSTLYSFLRLSGWRPSLALLRLMSICNHRFSEWWIEGIAFALHYVVLRIFFDVVSYTHVLGKIVAPVYLALAGAALLLMTRPHFVLVRLLCVMKHLRCTPPPPEPGSRPTLQSWMDEQRPIVIEERHLLVEGAPAITCAICLDDLRLGHRALRLPCRHFFHPECVSKWVKEHNSCPTCRHPLPSNTYIDRLEALVANELKGTFWLRLAEQPQPPPSNTSTRTAFSPSPTAESEEGIDGGLASSSTSDSVEALLQLPVRELRRLANNRGISLRGCVEKIDVVRRLAAPAR